MLHHTIRSALNFGRTNAALARRNLALSGKVMNHCKLGKLNHIAIAVPDLDKATALYRDVLGADVSAKQDLPEHGVTTVFVNLPNTKLELLYPFGENSPIASYLSKNKSGGLHHICIEVKDIKSAMETIRAKGLRTLSEEPKIGAHGKPVIFCHPKDCNGVLLELEQE